MNIMCVLILLSIFVVCDAMQDTVAYHFDTSIFKNLNKYYFDPSFSWTNKYKDNNPLEGEKFFGSTTFLVWLTDFWHLMKFIKMNCIWIALSVASCVWWLYFIGILLHGVLFEGVYKIIKKK